MLVLNGEGGLVKRTRLLLGALVIALSAAGSAVSAPPQKVPGCPAGYEKGSTIDFPQFAYADRNGNTLVCFRYNADGTVDVRDDHPAFPTPRGRGPSR